MTDTERDAPATLDQLADALGAALSSTVAAGGLGTVITMLVEARTSGEVTAFGMTRIRERAAKAARMPENAPVLAALFDGILLGA